MIAFLLTQIAKLKTAISSISGQVGNIRNVKIGEADVTTTGNGNFSIQGIGSKTQMIVSITVMTPDDVVAIPYKYGTGEGALGGHAMSCLASQTAVANENLHIKYAYVDI